MVAISRIFQRQPFEPEVTRAMGIAFEQACERLGVAGRLDAVTERVAKQVIEAAREGYRDPARICERALQALRPDAETS